MYLGAAAALGGAALFYHSLGLFAYAAVFLLLWWARRFLPRTRS